MSPPDLPLSGGSGFGADRRLRHACEVSSGSALAPLAVALGRSAVRGARHFRRRRRSSRSLVDMPSSAKHLTLESMAVLLNESHAEALAEAGIVGSST